MSASSHDVCAALDRRFNPESKPPQYATFREVSDAAQKRRIDFIAINTWQSRGRIVEGVEVKVARADWLKELAHPKADSWYRVVNRWWIAAPPGVVNEDELPEPWGLLEMRPHRDSTRLFKVKEAPKLTPDEEWPAWFVMRLLARGIEVRNATPQEILKARDDGYQDGVARGKAWATTTREQEQDATRQLHALLAALGLPTYGGEYGRIDVIRQAVALVNNGNLDRQAENLARRYREVADAIESTLSTVALAPIHAPEQRNPA